MTLRMLLAAALAAMTWPALAQESTAGRSLSATCAHCHGTAGHSVTQEVAPLAGRPKDYIASQMKAFQGGTRPATVMHQIAKGYTDAQIEALADFLSRQAK